MQKIRVLIAKLGLDGHDRGAKFISRFLRDAGMEVIYTGIRQTPEFVGRVALQEDVDVIGVSILSGAHRTLVPQLMTYLAENDIETPVIVGGIIPEDDIPFLESAGVKSVFTSGTAGQKIVGKIHEIIQTTEN